MEFLDEFDFDYHFLDEELGLIKPNLNQSVAGLLPETVRNWNVDIKEDPGLQRNSEFSNKLNENFPSGYDNVLFIICDGLGVEHLSQTDGLIWHNLTTNGSIASTMFPSMTSTVMTSLSYGRFPSDHGLVGYNIYNEYIDGIWNALNLHSNRGEGAKYVLDEVKLEQLVSGRPIVDMIGSAQVEVGIDFIAPSELKSPSLLDLINPSIKTKEYSSPEELIQLITHSINQTDFPQLTATYLGYADHFGHQFGPESRQYQQAIALIEHVVSQVLEHEKVKDGSTAVILTSDHGQVQVNHDISYWMGNDEWRGYIENDMVFSTSGRVLHGYSLNNDPEMIYHTLNQFANDRGMVISNEEAMRLAGGDSVHASRMGDYVMLMEDEYLYDVPEIVPYGEPGKLYGQHGSLTSKELFVPAAIFGANL